MFSAYADESARFTSAGSRGCYVIAAVVVADGDAQKFRDVMAPLAHRPKGFHWAEADKAQRHEAVEAILSVPSLHVVSVAAPLDNARQERARRLCLERLLFELESAGVDHVYLERRTEILNQKDRDVVDGFRARRVIAHIRIDHAPPANEPLLWVPDVVAGAIGLDAVGRGSEYWQMLAPLVERHNITLR
jgi:hypothetical protein